jgi:hypothetical protein
VATNPTSFAATNQNSKIENQKSSAPLARIHWLGKKRLAADTNAADFMTVWNLPESARLEAQTLDKLALWLAGWRPSESNHLEITNWSALVASNTKASQLRPLVQDLLQEEWLLEVRTTTNQPSELALAIRLDDRRAAAWQSAEAGIRDALSALRRQACALTLARSNNWTLLGLTESPGTNSLFTSFSSQLAATGNPFSPAATNYWLEANIDLLKVSSIWPLLSRLNNQVSSNWPTISLKVVGADQSVRTLGDLEFPHPLHLELEPWNIPTNLIHDPLISFTAIRGVAGLLNHLKSWTDLQVGPPPNQVYFWGLAGMPGLEYGAAPMADASNVVQKAGDSISTAANPWLTLKGIGSLVRATNFNGITWKGAPFVEPQLRSFADGGIDFALAGLMPPVDTKRLPPPELFESLASRPKLILYDWELTAPRLDQCLYLSQLARFIAHRAQLPPGSASFQLIKAASQRFGNCITVVTGAEPNRLSLIRRSSCGFSALEQHLLADWLESPGFPHGLHTTLAPLPLPAVQPPPGAGARPGLPK